ncbi:protein LONGIFOLIA 1 [Jatropha curcas]|uniref:protein LONGIFOLIA 1 n=1 Tax=Jatropha curcas TaxID=180498 RepID=UPI0018952BAA|nr:protein LONGIFOLIA 1 [Jatropha curcas]
MPAKFIHNLPDENPDLQKQIGCMNGILQLFDRHHFLGGGRRAIGQNRKSLPSSGQSGNDSKEQKNAAQNTTEKNQKKAIKEKQRVSTESSRTSFSSACSSSLSSLECNNVPQLEPCSFNQTIVPDVHARDSPVYQPNASFRSSQQSPDLRDVVKDSIYREARGLSVKTANKGETGGLTLKYFDSPRPFQHPESVNPKVSGSKEPFQVLHKLREAPPKLSGGKTSTLKDARRFSCDGRETRDALKSTIKLKELPRLSLDSRAVPVRGSTIEMKSNDLLGNLERADGKLNNFSNQDEEPESRTRLSNVVAKLMGLEALPNSMSTDGNMAREIKAHPGVEKNTSLGLSRTTDENKQNTIPGSPRNLHKEPTSPRVRNVHSVKKPIPNSKIPIETAPWKQLDGNRNSQTPALKNRTNIPKAPDTSLTVYGEIQKRLAQLEFKRSGKDLRALKQILEAMQKTKEILETKAARLETEPTSKSSIHQNSKSSSQCNLQSNSPTTLTRRTDSPKSFKSPIVIMKPAKLIQKASNPSSSVNPVESFSVLHEPQTADFADGRTAKDLTPRANHLKDRSSPSSRTTDKNTVARLTGQFQPSKEPQSSARENTNSVKSSGTLNLRQPKKLGLEKQARQTTPSSESIRNRRQSSRQRIESGSPHRKSGPKSLNLQPSDDESSDIGSDVRDLSHQGDALSMQSESTISLASQVDEEVSSTDRSNKANISFIQKAQQRQRKPVARSTAEPVAAPSEQPSPVSVLDATFYVDDLPSPIKKKSIAFKEDEVVWSLEEANHSCSNNSSLNSMINHKKVENIHFLVQNLRKLLSIHEEPFTDGITPLYDSKNPDHKYVSDILLASGILKDFESTFTIVHRHQAGYPINPNVFLALEQAKASTRYSNDEESGMKTAQSEYHIKIQRKLLFDVVNEILTQKLLLESSYKYPLLPNIPEGKRPRGQQLLGELCSKVDRMQVDASNCSLDDENDSLRSILQADLMQHSTYWTTCSSEIPGLVLDIERLIFKDLISEVVNGEALALTVQSGGHCRQQLSK